MLSSQKKNSFLSFHSPIVRSKIHKRHGYLFEKVGGGVTHLSKRTLREECQKLEISSERTF